MTDLSKARKKRTTKKNVIIRDVLPECEDLITGYRNEESRGNATAMIQTLEDKIKEMKVLDDEVTGLLENDDELEKHESDASKFSVDMRKMQVRLKGFVSEEKREPSIVGNKKNWSETTKNKYCCFRRGCC